MTDFSSEKNPAGHNLLLLVSRGNAIIAELLRLSENIPSVFFLWRKEDTRRYSDIIFDFKYFNSVDLFETKIESTPGLLDLDEAFRDDHIEILERFYALFESLFKNAGEFVKYLQSLESGIFVHQNLESTLSHSEGKQLLAEALYLIGVTLILMDRRIPGIVRERLLVSYHRYKGSADIPNFQEVCDLCKSTGFTLDKPPPLYPEDFFSRVKVPEKFVHLLLGRLRNDDVYHMLENFPAPEHRSMALANQASLTFMILYFAPRILSDDFVAMREIVDRFFPDNWVLSYYMGYHVDISQAWDAYKAAKAALVNTISTSTVREMSLRYTSVMDKCNVELTKYLAEGVLTQDYVLDNISELMDCLRDCNSALHWLILHSKTSSKRLLEAMGQTSMEDVLGLLLDTAQFEFVIRDMIRSLMKTKEKRWEQLRKDTKERIDDLGDFFGTADKRTTKSMRSKTLKEWFSHLSSHVASIDFSDAVFAGRKIQQLIRALEDVTQYHQVENNLQIRQFLGDSRVLLAQMLRTVNVREEVLSTLAVVGDFAYANEIVKDYVALMQQRIKQQPSSVLKLRSVFLKLASILDLPLGRIQEAQSADLESVAQYYSGVLVEFVRQVLEIVPVSMFGLLDKIIQVRTGSIRELPASVPKAEIKDFVQTNERRELARLTHEVSVFTEGILAMETTLVGVIQVEPKQLLEDGIRRELVRLVSRTLHGMLVFKSGKVDEFEDKLRAVGEKLQGYRRSFEYIQDYVSIYGLKIWQEEVSRIISYYAEQECNTYLKRKVYDWKSQYQNTTVPIPNHEPLDDRAETFIGRVADVLLTSTDAKRATYIEPMTGWFDSQGRELVGLRTFALIRAAIGVYGLTAVDKLLSFMAAHRLQEFMKWFVKSMDKSTRKIVSAFEEEIEPTSAIPTCGLKGYQSVCTRVGGFWQTMLETIQLLGQIQILRTHIRNELSGASRLDSGLLHHALENVNKSLIADLRAKSGGAAEGDDELAGLLARTSSLLTSTGLANPLEQVYVTLPAPPSLLALVMFLFVNAQLPKLVHDKDLDILTSRTKRDSSTIDGVPFTIGVVTVFRQIQEDHTQKFVRYLAQYVATVLDTNLTRESIAQMYKQNKGFSLPPAATSALLLLKLFMRYAHIPRHLLLTYIPELEFLIPE